MFKPGDRVRIRKDLEEIYLECKKVYPNLPKRPHRMNRYKGCISTVKEVMASGSYGLDMQTYKLNLHPEPNGSWWFWPECYLELVEDDSFEIESETNLVDLIGGELHV